MIMSAATVPVVKRIFKGMEKTFSEMFEISSDWHFHDDVVTQIQNFAKDMSKLHYASVREMKKARRRVQYATKRHREKEAAKMILNANAVYLGPDELESATEKAARLQHSSAIKSLSKTINKSAKKTRGNGVKRAP